MPDERPDHGERIIQLTGEHWIRFAVPVTVAVFLCIVTFLLFLLAGVTAHHYLWLSHGSYIAAVTLFFVLFHWLFMLLLSESLNTIIVTNRRLLRIQYSLIFHEDILEISFEKMKTVDARKTGLLQNIFHYGTLYFETKLATVRFVPHPNRTAGIIQEAMRAK